MHSRFSPKGNNKMDVFKWINNQGLIKVVFTTDSGFENSNSGLRAIGDGRDPKKFPF